MKTYGRRVFHCCFSFLVDNEQVVSSSVGSMDVFLDDFMLFLQPANNQKFGLVQALLRIGEWRHVRRVLDRLPAFSAVAHPPVARAMCDLLHHTLEPLYSKYVPIRRANTNTHAHKQNIHTRTQTDSEQLVNNPTSSWSRNWVC